MGFYEFNQNNTGGSFITDEKLCHRVVIEANDAKEAIDLAEDMGVYFNGCDDGIDCPCCGDRWYEPYNEDTYPKKYGENIVNTPEDYYQVLADQYGWTTPDARIFYLDGKVNEVFKQPKGKDKNR